MLELPILFCLTFKITLLSVFQDLEQYPKFVKKIKLNIYIMRNLLKLKSILILSAIFFFASCSNMSDGETIIEMRNFSQMNARSIKGKTSDQSKTGQIKSISNEVSDNWTSTVFKVEDGRMVPCDNCDINDFEITQVFLKKERSSGDHTFLYRNNSTTNASHTFTGKDVIGIDLNYKGEYVRMSDIDVFSKSQDEEYSYVAELGVNVFTNESTGRTSAVYNFPVGSSAANPGNSLSGMWMRIVLDFYQ